MAVPVFLAIDLATIAACLLCMGLLIAVGYTFTRLADVLNFSVLGIRPLANVASAIEATVIAGCNAGVKALSASVTTLWKGVTWSVDEFRDGIHRFVNATEDALQHFRHSALPAYVTARLATIHKQVAALDARIDGLASTGAKAVTGVEAQVTAKLSALDRTLTKQFNEKLALWENGIEGRINARVAQAQHDFGIGIDRVRSDAQSGLDQLRGAEDAALGALRKAEDATAEQLREQIRNLDQSQLAGLIAAVPALAALVNVITAESGLDRAECRSKVKQICGTDPGAWETLLLGALAIDFALNLEGIVAAGREIIHYVESGAEDLASLV